MSKRYIEAELAEENIRKWLDIKPSELVPSICKKVEDIAVNAIRLTPTADVVEVVRCKDCKYFKYGDYCTEGKMEHSKCRENDYCSYGERRAE